MGDKGGISRGVLGEFLRGMRRDAGYRNTETFSQALAEKAGYEISKEAVYRIESGRQEASISYICAACITVCGEIMPWRMKNMICAAACDAWQAVDEKTATGREKGES